MNLVKPLAWAVSPIDSRDDYLRKVCATVGVDYPERPTGLIDEVRQHPKPMEVLAHAQAKGLALSDIEEALCLAVTCEHVASTYTQALTGLARSTNNYDERLESIMPKVQAKAKATYKAMGQALEHLPEDPFDREAVFASDATVHYRTLTEGIETLNVLVGTQGRITSVHGRALLSRYVLVNPNAQLKGDDLAALNRLNSLCYHGEHEQALARAIRGDFGSVVTAQLPTLEEAKAGEAVLDRAQVHAQAKYRLPTWN